MTRALGMLKHAALSVVVAAWIIVLCVAGLFDREPLPTGWRS